MMKEGWVEVPLVDVCDICDHLRKPINSKERNKRVLGKTNFELYPYYGATGQVGLIDAYRTDGEYILIGEDGAPFLDYRKDIAYRIKGKTWVNNHAHILCSHFNNEFLLYFLNQFNFHGHVSGTTRLKLTQDSLKKIPFKVAPLNEQTRIVAKIEELFSELDSGVESLKKAKEQLKLYRQSVLKQAFEGKFIKNFQKDQFSIIDLGSVIEEPTYGTSKKCSYDNGNIGVLRIPNIVSGKIELSDLKFASFNQKESERYSLSLGDILFIRSNGSVSIVGKSALILQQHQKLLFAGYLIRIRPKTDKVLARYLNYQLSSHNLRSQIELVAKSTSGVNNINSKEIKKLKIAICSLDVQQKVVDYIESRFSIIDQLESDIETNLKKAETLRQSILKKAFSGQLVPQDPNDEPASVLLEKIKAEKSKAKTKAKIRAEK